MPLYLRSIVRTELTSFWEESHKEGNAYIKVIIHSDQGEGEGKLQSGTKVVDTLV